MFTTFIIAHSRNDILSYDNIINSLTTGDKGTLVLRDERGQKRSQTGNQNFRKNFIHRSTQTNGMETFHIRRRKALGNETNESVTPPRRNASKREGGKNRLNQIITKREGTVDHQANSSKQTPCGMCISDLSCVKLHVHIQARPANPKRATTKLSIVTKASLQKIL